MILAEEPILNVIELNLALIILQQDLLVILLEYPYCIT